MVEQQRSSVVAEEFVEFWAAGVAAKGEFHCSECRYGVTVHNTLPTCPMCGCESWEQTAWHPFTSRAGAMPHRLL